MQLKNSHSNQGITYIVGLDGCVSWTIGRDACLTQRSVTELRSLSTRFPVKPSAFLRIWLPSREPVSYTRMTDKVYNRIYPVNIPSSYPTPLPRRESLTL